jgi:hypothetical protein
MTDDLTFLSTRARRWLADRGVERERRPADEESVRSALSRAGAPAWPKVIAVELRYGGLRGTDPNDACEVWFGSWPDSGFGATRKIDERVHVLVGGNGPIRWFIDEAGRIVEIDDLGERFYESDTIEHRVEQLALFDVGTHVKALEGRHGERIAKELHLVSLREPSDSRQRFWTRDAEDPSTLLVRESLEPSDYGRRDLVPRTWLSASHVAALTEASRAK